jgi:hypothetical protein
LQEALQHASPEVQQFFSDFPLRWEGMDRPQQTFIEEATRQINLVKSEFQVGEQS